MAKRKKGEGTVRLRKDGRWEGRCVIGYEENGNPKTKNVLAKTKRECIEKLEALKKDCNIERPVKLKSDMRFGDWLDYWYKNFSKPGLRQTTQINYENWIYNHTIPQIGDIPLNKLTQSELQQFFRRMKESGRTIYTEQLGSGMSDRSVRSCYAVCRMALDKAASEGLIRVNPAISCKLPPIKKKEMQVLSLEEVQRFLIQAKEEGMYELFLLELTTGMRRGELLALKWDDLDAATGELRINKQVYTIHGKLTVSEPKTKAAVRTIILPPAMVELLLEYKKDVFSDWMFPSRKRTGPPDPGYICKRLQEILERAGCKKVRFHDLRHTFSTMALENGMDIKTLSTIIGHVSSSTTLNTYAHITNDMQKKAAMSIDKGIAKAETVAPQEEQKPTEVDFTPVKPKRRRPGTGCISQVNDHIWEGRYSPIWPDGKKHSRDIYAPTLEECEAKLKILIREMKAEIEAERRKLQK